MNEQKIDQTQAVIIATMILFPETIHEITNAVHRDWFTGEYKKAFLYLEEMEGGDVASVSAATGLPATTICSWVDLEFTTAFLASHCQNLELEATKRKIQSLGRQLISIQSPDEANILIERYTASLTEMSKSEPVSMKKGLAKLMKEIDRRYKQNGKITGMSYGIEALDFYTEGMHHGDLVIIAGSSSMGKTSFALGAAESAASHGFKTLVFSCEMTTEQLLMRSVASSSCVPLSLIRAPQRLRDFDFPRITESVGKMSDWPMLIDDPAGITLSELTRKARRAKKNGLDLMLVDYLQIMKYDKSKEVMELDNITTGLKNLAKELKICVMLLSQLNRGSEKDKRKPVMSDLRGSGMIENNADVILFPYREAAGCQKCLDKIEDGEHSTKAHQAKAEIIIGKQRQGERNVSVPCLWMGSRTRFFDTNERNGHD